MSLVPDDKVGKIQYFEGHLNRWAQNAEQLGFTPEMIAEMTARTQAARAALQQQYMAQNAARGATENLHAALEEMMTTGAAMIRQVRARAAAEGEGMYVLASIPAPAKPSPIGEPGEPTKFTATLDAIGAITLRWTCKNPKGAVGTVYQVWRQIGSSGPFVCLGMTGVKKFVDDALPQGLAEVTYQVQAVRSTKAGPPARFTVNFGTGRRRLSPTIPTMRPTTPDPAATTPTPAAPIAA